MRSPARPASTRCSSATAPAPTARATFLNAIAGILGDYHRTAPIETFTASNSDRHPTELAGLRGARLVTATETEEGRRWAESRIKTLTGGDQIAARFMRQDFFEFMPQFKLVIAGNHKPGLRSRRRGHPAPLPPDPVHRHDPAQTSATPSSPTSSRPSGPASCNG